MSHSIKCKICNSDFTNLFNFRRHVRQFHPDKVSELAPKRIYPCVAICSECNKSFCSENSFRLHIKRFHPSKADELIKSKRKNWNYQCTECDRRFNQSKNFKYHQKHAHGQQESIQKFKNKCPICEYEDPSKSKMIKHYTDEHQIPIEKEELEFKNFREFENWKSEMEKYTNSRFVKLSGIYKVKGASVQKFKYMCHRSGSFTSKGKGLRKLRNNGSNKINGFCPACLEILIQDDGKCKITYVKSHVGHNNDLKHQPLTKDDREKIAAKIAADVPFRVILDEIRDSISTTGKLERTHLITRKDLYNIVKGFKLEDDSRIPADGLSIQDWVNEMSDKGCVLYHKFKGTSCNKYVDLKEEDFILVIMNRGQMEMLKKYGSNCICIDRSHYVNADDLELISLLVVDEIEEGFPCSFLVANRIDEETLSLFYSCVKEKLGTKLEPKVFMSDIDEIFYNAWLSVMEPSKFKFFCSWHVDKAWRSNLLRVESKKTQAIIYEKLRSLLQEEDVETFVNSLEDFMEELLSDESTVDFCCYFQHYFSENWKTWANCYRIQHGINASMHLERVHATLCKLYLHGRKFNRSNMAVTSVMKFVKDRLYEVMIRNEGFTKTTENRLDKESNALVSKEIVVIKDENVDNLEDDEVMTSGTEEPIYTASKSSNPNTKTNQQELLRMKKEKLLDHISSIVEGCSTNEELETIKRLIVPIQSTLKIVRKYSFGENNMCVKSELIGGEKLIHKKCS